jgi:hypothetical protein
MRFFSSLIARDIGKSSDDHLAGSHSYEVMSCSCEPVAIQQGHEHGSRGIFIVRSRYQATTSEHIEDYVCCSYSDLECLNQRLL